MSSYRFSEWKPKPLLPEMAGMAKGSIQTAADKIEVGKRLRRVRLALKLTGKTLAGMIGNGCTEQKISNYENGRDGLPREFAARIWTTTGADFNYLYGGSMLTIPSALRDEIVNIEMAEAEDAAPKRIKRR